MVSFASVADLSTFIGHNVDAVRGELLLETASSLIAEAVGVPIVEQNETVRVDGTGTKILLLPSWPVTDVASVTVDGDLIEPDRYHWSRSGVVELAPVWGSTTVVNPLRAWPARRRSVEITYTHGFAQIDIPDAIRRVCLHAAARLEMNPQSLRDFTDGTTTAGFAVAGMRLTADERAMVVRSLR